MFNNPYLNTQPIDRINNQIKELEQIKAQYQQIPQQPTNLTQNFQITPTTAQNGFKMANNIDEVKKIIVFADTMFINKDFDIMWLKKVNNEIRTFSITEIIPKDEKDLVIEDLQRQLNELRGSVNNEQYDENNGQYDNETKPTNDEPVSKSTRNGKAIKR